MSVSERVAVVYGTYVNIIEEDQVIKDWTVFENATYPILLHMGKRAFTEVDASWGYDRCFSERLDYVDYIRHTARSVLYGFYFFDKDDKTWSGC